MSDTTHKTIEVSGNPIDLDFSDQQTVIITDRRGQRLRYHIFEGVLYPPFVKVSTLKQIKSFKMRPDDVYFSGYPRTGTHWTFEMMGMLLNGCAETIKRFKDHIETHSFEDLDKLPSPRIIHGHIKLSSAPDDVLLKKVKVVYTLRDPKDVAVSLFNAHRGRAITGELYNGSFEDYLPLFLSGTVEMNGYLEHLRDAHMFFAKNPGTQVHIQRYESTIQDPVTSVQKLSDFLGVERNDELCQAIAQKCEFSRMKTDKEKYAFTFGGENFLYRKGTVGDWKNYFTDAMLDKYYEVFDEKLKGTAFYELYSRDKDLNV